MQQLSFVPYLHFLMFFFHQTRVERVNKKMTHSSYERIWNHNISHLRLKHMHCSLVDDQLSVGLWDSINPCDILLTYLNGWTQNWIYLLLGLIDSIHHGGQACSEGMLLSDNFNLWMHMLCYEPTEWFVESWVTSILECVGLSWVSVVWDWQWSCISGKSKPKRAFEMLGVEYNIK
jgi:hypothetical protein